MPPNNTDIFLRFVLDEAANRRVEQGISTLAQELEKIGVGADAIKGAQFGEAIAAEAGKATRAVEAMGDKIVKTNEEIAKSLQAEARVLRSEAADIVSGLEHARIGALNKAASTIGGLSKTALFAGGGILGGAFLEVNKYVSDAKEATAITRAWKQETDSLAKSRGRVDAVLAREALPMLREAARLANQAAAFVEEHPEIVSAALEVGKILVALSVLGTLTSKGIKLVADVRYLATIPAQLAAAKLQDEAAKKQLAAATLRAKELGISLPGKGAGLLTGAGVASVLGPILAVLGGAVIGAAINDKITEATGRGAKTNQFLTVGAQGLARNVLEPIAERFGTSPEEAQRKTLVFTAIIGKLTGAIDKNHPLWIQAANSIKKASEIVERVVTGLAGSENEEAVVSAFAKWQEDDRRLIEEATENRKKILADAEKEIANATRQYALQRVNINKQFDRSRANIIKDFAESSKQEEINYAKARANIIKGTGEDIQRIEEQHQENIRKMTLDHNQRVEDLTASRDALGLAKEHRQFDQDLTEAERETNQEIAQRRRETAIRLQELAAEYAAERAQRQVQFEQNLAENEVRRQEELKEAAIAHAEELKQLREKRAAQLRELQEGLNAERLRRREVFIAEIRDLDSALLGERNLKNKYYALMLQDAERWLASYRARQPGSTGTTGSAIPIRDLGGYVNKGVYRMAWNGVPEFVMSGATTRAAERVIGGQLNQQSVMRALASGRGNVTLHYQPRIDSRVSLEDRRAIQADLMQTIQRELG